MKIGKESIRLLVGATADYSIRLAGNAADIQAAQKLRFQIFNLELKEGLQGSYATGLDADPFDAVCDHLLVEHATSGELVGTYRLQMGPSAGKNLGYYSEQEFDFKPFEPFRSQIVELGRACVDKKHRNLIVLGKLWKGIADYAKANGGRYLLGCSSLTSQDPAEGASAYAQLARKNLAAPEWLTKPTPAYDCPLDKIPAEPTHLPKLLRAYLSLGAKICGPPALDRQFGTIDFLTLVDLETMPQSAKDRFVG